MSAGAPPALGAVLRGYDVNGNAIEVSARGWLARIFQHEYDHLDGKLFIDHVSPLRRTLLKSKLAAMTKGKYKAHYPCKLVKK